MSNGSVDTGLDTSQLAGVETHISPIRVEGPQNPIAGVGDSIVAGMERQPTDLVPIIRQADSQLEGLVDKHGRTLTADSSPARNLRTPAEQDEMRAMADRPAPINDSAEHPVDDNQTTIDATATDTGTEVDSPPPTFQPGELGYDFLGRAYNADALLLSDSENGLPAEARANLSFMTEYRKRHAADPKPPPPPPPQPQIDPAVPGGMRELHNAQLSDSERIAAGEQLSPQQIAAAREQAAVSGNALSPDQRQSQALMDALTSNGVSISDLAERLQRGEKIQNPLTNQDLTEGDVQGVLVRQQELAAAKKAQAVEPVAQPAPIENLPLQPQDELQAAERDPQMIAAERTQLAADLQTALAENAKNPSPETYAKVKELRAQIDALGPDQAQLIREGQERIANGLPPTAEQEAAMEGRTSSPDAETKSPEEIREEEKQELLDVGTEFFQSFIDGDLTKVDQLAQTFNEKLADQQSLTVSERGKVQLRDFVEKLMDPQKAKSPQESARMKFIKEKLLGLAQLELRLRSLEQQAENINKSIKDAQNEAAKAENDYYNEDDPTERGKKQRIYEGHVLRVQSLLDAKEELQPRWLKDDIDRRNLLGDIHRAIGSKGLFRNLLWGLGTAGRQVVYGGVQIVNYPRNLVA